MRLIFALIAFTNPAWAACNANERTFLACSFENGRSVEVCTTDTTVRYSYGRVGQTPELALSLRFGKDAEDVPWPGVGRTIWDTVRLTNNDVTYEIIAGMIA